eukprot:NODE_1055_length_1598_cov_5.791478_g873_i0.p1 GENE.NODE_1055_length_1598_cov_5.791478_g873_i0~~NODE_1055_length_1598_cov_5.791478_g873_i0.p1  ORF type:complete len:422 (-),score=88.04 NODE_1055_length_1598_cov_5.791478_g873_i0:150-1415(-)
MLIVTLVTMPHCSYNVPLVLEHLCNTFVNFIILVGLGAKAHSLFTLAVAAGVIFLLLQLVSKYSAILHRIQSDRWKIFRGGACAPVPLPPQCSKMPWHKPPEDLEEDALYQKASSIPKVGPILMGNGKMAHLPEWRNKPESTDMRMTELEALEFEEMAVTMPSPDVRKEPDNGANTIVIDADDDNDEPPDFDDFDSQEEDDDSEDDEDFDPDIPADAPSTGPPKQMKVPPAPNVHHVARRASHKGIASVSFARKAEAQPPTALMKRLGQELQDPEGLGIAGAPIAPGAHGGGAFSADAFLGTEESSPMAQGGHVDREHPGHLGRTGAGSSAVTWRAGQGRGGGPRPKGQQLAPGDISMDASPMSTTSAQLLATPASVLQARAAAAAAPPAMSRTSRPGACSFWMQAHAKILPSSASRPPRQ